MCRDLLLKWGGGFFPWVTRDFWGFEHFATLNQMGAAWVVDNLPLSLSLSLSLSLYTT